MTALFLGADCLANPTRHDQVHDAGADDPEVRQTVFDPDGGADWRGPGGQMEGAACTIPAGRMKAGRVHRVPPAPRCIDVLKQAKPLAAGSEFVFPGVPARSRC